jgi:hypothetical protein
MTVGICILAHSHLYRVEQLVHHFAERDCRVAVHVDSATAQDEFDQFVTGVQDLPNVVIAPRQRCEWGTFALHAAALDTAELLIDTFPEVNHVSLISGSCLPMRPVKELQTFLSDHPNTDFVESKRLGQERWVQEGLEEERFTLYHPFKWRRQRWAFDLSVELQRKLRIKRRAPEGLELAMGSQWWTLTRRTLRRIINDPRRSEWERFFKRAWIVDEAYIQTMIRRHSVDFQDVSLTLTEFDPQGKPFTFYDDHSQILAKTNKFFARKIWHGANALYNRYLFGAEPLAAARRQDAIPEVAAMVETGRERRCRGRAGPLSQSRFPCRGFEDQHATPNRYLVLNGYDFVFGGMEQWLQTRGVGYAHGRLFRQGRVEFAQDRSVMPGGLTADPRVRDWHPVQFLTNLLYQGRDEFHSFQFTASDSRPVSKFILKDPNAVIFSISGAWMLDLLPSMGEEQEAFRRRAQHLQRVEQKFEQALTAETTRASVYQFTLEDVLAAPAVASHAIETMLPAAEKVVSIMGASPQVHGNLRIAALRDRLHSAGIATDSFHVLPSRVAKSQQFMPRVLREMGK